MKPRYGWIPDLPDARDHTFKLRRRLPRLPSSVDLRPGCPPVYNQGSIGSCTANAIGAAMEFNQRKQKLKKRFMPSRLFIYYNERVVEGTVPIDAGAQLRTGIKCVASQGACPETSWPYIETCFTAKPSDACYRSGARHPVIEYSRLDHDLDQLKSCLASGYPFVFGFTAYQGFESGEVAKTGAVAIPGASQRALGGHAVLAVGYDDAGERFLVRNSWGPDWGLAGHFTLPYGYMTHPNLTADFWTIRVVQ